MKSAVLVKRLINTTLEKSLDQSFSFSLLAFPAGADLFMFVEAQLSSGLSPGGL